jgi:hypothetical protein
MPPRRSGSIPADNNEPNYSRIDPAYQPECDIESCPYLSPSKAGKPVRTVKKTLAFKARKFIRYPTVPHGFPTSVLRNAKRSTRVEPRPLYNIAEVFPEPFDETTKVHEDFIVRKFINRNMLKWGEANIGADWEELCEREKPEESQKDIKQPTPIKKSTVTPIKQRTPIHAITDGKLLRTIAARKREAAKERENARRLQREEDFLQCEEDFADIIRATPK